MNPFKISKKAIIGLIIIFFIMIGSIWQFVMIRIEKRSIIEVGKELDVGNYKMRYYSKGEGDTTFVFIPGSETPSSYTDFYKLQNFLSKKGQAISYDRAGSGWSTYSKSKRTVKNLEKELSLLIDKTASDNSIVLICHSIGSLDAIRYAQLNPTKVKGIVFLDCASPEYDKEASELMEIARNRVGAVIRTIGINRLFGETGFLLPVYGESLRNSSIPKEIKEIDKYFYYKTMGNSASLGIIQQMNDNAEVVLDGPTLGDIPILLISSDKGDDWKKVQKQLASWSNNSTQITLSNSSHYIHWSNYDEVTENIEKFLSTIGMK